jgi:kynurenine formamidase
VTLISLTRQDRLYTADLADPLSIAMPLDFDGAQPNHFGAPPAHAAPLAADGFVGDVRAGGTVNCEHLHLVPHCNGTHTECVGHVTTDRIGIHEVLHGGLFVACVISVRPERCAASGDTPCADAAPDELVITGRALEQALAERPGIIEALVIRTLPNDATKLQRRYQGDAAAPYLTPEAARLLVARDVQHVIVDLPSLDRASDGGRLAAHRIFWGMPAGSQRLHDATRRDATVTELAWIAPMVRDGWYLLDLQVPAFISDAAPSRPLLYPVKINGR